MSTKVAAARLSVGSNLLLVAIKLAVGLASGSVSIISEAIHSAVDLVAAGWIVVESVRKLAGGGHSPSVGLGLLVMGLSAGLPR